jgi:alkylhydroperoxidase/carboxymuconolactone decarboxylase family protein YurZ
MNDKILAEDNKVIKRIFNLDTHAYAERSIDIMSKEMIGLACSMVLRRDDCVKYPLGKSHKAELTKEQLFEVFSTATLIGGTIVFPDLKRAA